MVSSFLSQFVPIILGVTIASWAFGIMINTLKGVLR